MKQLFLFFVVFLISLQFCQAQEKVSANVEKLGAKVLILSADKSETFGTLEFRQNFPRKPVSIKGTLSGIPPGLHAVHVHTFGDIGNGCRNVGGHYNPFNQEHGAPSDEERHVGDVFGNVRANSRGIVHVDISDSVIDLSGPTSIVGRSVLIHENLDDLGRGDDRDSKSTGNAGRYIGCGVIGIAERDD